VKPDPFSMICCRLDLNRNINFIYKHYTNKMEASSSKGGRAPVDIKKLVNQIFARRGAPEVKNFPKEFADGSKLYFLWEKTDI